MIVLKMMLWVVIISTVIAILAVIIDLKKTQNNGHKPYGLYEKFFKRGLDAFLSTGALIVLSPVLIVVAYLVRMKLGRPVLFTQKRPGKDEKIFKLYKFRTMTDERDAEGNLLSDEARLTKFGKLLRSTSLDELPELFNIIKGDMAVIGPRPLLVKYLPYYTEEQRKRHLVRPGLTGYAQAHGRNSVSWDERLAMDVGYVSEITFMGDAQILFRTIKSVIKREGISSETSETMEDFIDYCKSIGRV